jgi:hypothetical protein
MKCLQRDPDRRYGSAGDLRDDLTRFLEERPVLARRPRLVLKAAHLIKRNRKPLAAISLVGTFMLLGLSVLFFRWLRGRDIQRIQWTLQQVIDSGRAPGELLSRTGRRWKAYCVDRLCSGQSAISRSWLDALLAASPQEFQPLDCYPNRPHWTSPTASP